MDLLGIFGIVKNESAQREQALSRWRTLSIALPILFVACLPEPPLKRDYDGYHPKELDDGWQTSTAEAESMNAELLDEAFAQVFFQDGFLGARALLVFRHGRLVGEAYPRDEHHLHEINNVQSITKSIASILTGVAIDKGVLPAVNTPLFSIYPELFDDDANKQALTLEHALTMTTGLAYSDDQFLSFYQHEGDSAEFVLDLPLIDSPGDSFYYQDGAPQLVMKAIENGIDESLSQFAETHLFNRLGIDDYRWETANDQTPFGAFGVFLTPRDLGRLGQLLLNNGVWDGERIVSEAWIEDATRIRPNLVGGGGQYFGYYFWLNPSNGAYAARGNGGQFLYVVPNKDLVIVYTAAPSINEYLNYEHSVVNAIINSCY